MNDRRVTLRRIGSSVLAVAISLLAASAVSAQSTDGGPDPSKVRVRIGPVMLNPTISLTNLGIDTNVFNQPPALAKRDFTMTLTPATDIWLRMGRTWLQGNVHEDVVWYQKYNSERSGNTSYSLSWKVPLNRVSFSADGSWLASRERASYDIDARSKRVQTIYGGTAEIRALSKTFIGVTGQWQHLAYDRDAVFQGVNLHDELSHTTVSGGLTLRHELTPLTSVVFIATRDEAHFEFSSLRDADSYAFTTGVKFDPYALIKGGATFGVRDFRPKSSGLPGFRGAMAQVDLSYSIASTKVQLLASRDVQYSYDVTQPYYLLNNVYIAMTQQIFGPVDVVGRLGFQRLDYTDKSGASVSVANQVDHVKSYGGGLGYHLGRDMRVGVNLDKVTRESPVSIRQFEGLRVGMAITYGS